MSRIHSRQGWTLSFSRESVNIGIAGTLMNFAGPSRFELELDVYDIPTVHRLMDLGSRDCHPPVSVSMSKSSSWCRVRLEVTEAEAMAIANGTPPLEVLLMKPGTIVAVPDDLREFL
jgi:hypothetical protein